jgi:hypothetical protein
MDFWPRVWLCDFVRENHLAAYADHLSKLLFPKPEAIRKLVAEWPSVAEQFGIVAG